MHGLIAFRHPRQRLAGEPPLPECEAVAAERREIGARQQAQPVQPGTDGPPFIGGIAGDVRRRLGAFFGDRRLRLGMQAAFAGVAFHQFQDRGVGGGPGMVRPPLVAAVSPISRAEWNISPLNFPHPAGASSPAPPRSGTVPSTHGDYPPAPENVPPRWPGPRYRVKPRCPHHTGGDNLKPL